MLSGDLLLIIKWWTVLFFIGITFLPLTITIFKSFLDKGYIFSKVIGVCLISYAAFVLGSLHILSFSIISIAIIWILFTIINLLLLAREKIQLRKYLKIFLFEELIFLCCLIFWSFIRSHNPSIHDLEKFMDFGFINSILRSNYFPPRDMWLTPHSINYYFFGHLITAVLTKISGIPSFITFNLMIATIFAFCFSISFSIGTNLVNKIASFSLKKLALVGFIFAYCVSFSGNLQTIYSLFKSYQGTEFALPFWKIIFSPQTFPNSYWYPNATRFIHHTIHEFPSYSFVVADLHGHVLDIPVVLTLIALSLVLLLEKKIRIPIILLISFFLSIAYMTNAWDGIIYLGLVMNLIFVVELLKDNNKELIKKLVFSIINSAKVILFLALAFFLFSFIFNKNFSPFASGIGLICSPEFLIKLEKVGPFIFERGQCEHSPFWQLLILYGFFIYLVLGFLVFIRKKKLLASDIFVLLISLFSYLLIVIPEVFYLKDIYSGYFRANTMFKLSYQAFIMLSFSSIYIFVRMFSSFKKEGRTRISKIVFVVFMLGGLLLFASVSAYPYFSIPSGYDLKSYKGLNGINYLNEIKPSDLKAINWINQNISDQPVILEAQGDSYTDYGRISANTGLPTILGWTVHEWLWRGSYDVPSSRFDDIKNLYETNEIELAEKIIKKYDISLIYIGKLEKEKYKVSEDKFLKLGGIIFANGETNIYKIH